MWVLEVNLFWAPSVRLAIHHHFRHFRARALNVGNPGSVDFNSRQKRSSQEITPALSISALLVNFTPRASPAQAIQRTQKHSDT
jgi:hypothetical protein